MPNIGAPELILLIFVLLLLFGARKLPELARSMGRSTRILKAEMREDEPVSLDKPLSEEDGAGGGQHLSR